MPNSWFRVWVDITDQGEAWQAGVQRFVDHEVVTSRSEQYVELEEPVAVFRDTLDHLWCQGVLFD